MTSPVVIEAPMALAGVEPDTFIDDLEQVVAEPEERPTWADRSELAA